MTDFIGRYEILREVGRGGMAAVYLARDPRFKRNVAIKVLPAHSTSNITSQARFKQEAQTIAQLEHSAIVPVYDYGEQDKRPYLVMRYMPGGSLAEILDKRTFSIKEAIDMLDRLSGALDAAHDQNIIHRDVKSANILFDANEKAYLSDFGIVKLTQSKENITGSKIIGTPAYMSPEQIEAKLKLDGRSDVYSLGIVLFEALTNELPYDADTPMGLAMAHLRDSLPVIYERNSELPEQIQLVIESALAKEREARYPTAEALAKDFRKAVTLPTGFKTSVQPAPETTVLPKPHKSRRDGNNQGFLKRFGCAIGLVGGMLGAGLLVLAGIGIFSFIRSAATPSIEPVEQEAVMQPLEEEPAPNDATVPSVEPSARPPTPTSIDLFQPLPGSSIVKITDSAYNYFMGSLLPDQSKMIAFAKIDNLWQLVVLDPAQGLSVARLGNINANIHNPHISPDGSTILASMDHDGDFEIYLFDPQNGQVLAQLTDNNRVDVLPDWHPDGQRFVYVSTIDSREIMMGYLDGSEPERITFDSIDQFSPHVSPDGETIAYYANVSGNIDIYLMNLSTQEITRLSFDSGRDAEPAFSPDGQWIAFESKASGNYDIWAVRVDGSESVQITSASGDEQVPYFSLDGKWLFYQASQGDGEYDIYRIPWGL